MFNYDNPVKLLNLCPAYQATPMREVVYHNRKIIIKDESERMSLGSFKALGGAYAVIQLMLESVDIDFNSDEFLLHEIGKVAEKMTFVCASAGNHGLAVAAGAKIFGAHARIYLADTVPEGFAALLRDKGAEVVRAGENYEESILAAKDNAINTNAVLVADTSWPGYSEIPRLIMEGYTVIAEEMRQEFEQKKIWPTHVFLQAGVGGLAAAITFMIRHNWQVQPEIIIVEPDQAPCLAESIKRGKICTVKGAVSNMGRLDCKKPSLLAYDILRDNAEKFITVSDDEAFAAVKIASEFAIKTTPSGAAGLAGLINQLGDCQLPLIIITEKYITD